MSAGRIFLGIAVVVLVPFLLIVLLWQVGPVGPVEISLVYLLFALVVGTVFLVRRKKLRRR